jgi:EamA domain-containing membrane protein RarD
MGSLGASTAVDFIIAFFGFLAGPNSGYVQPAELLGDLLLPVVSVAVAIILFEEGLTLMLLI